MAVKGSILKKEITNKILNLFGDQAFLYNDGKEIRICGIEDGTTLQIKCVLTCAKANVECGGDIALPGETDFPAPINQAPTPVSTQPVAPTAEEKQTVANLLKKLNLM